MKKTIISFFVIFSLTVCVCAQGNNLSIINAASFLSYPQSISYKNKSGLNSIQTVNTSNEVKCISLNNTNLNDILVSSKPDIEIKEFPVTPTATGTIILHPQTPIVDANTEIWTNTKNGVVRGAPINIQSYYGTIEGQQNSKVYFTIAENSLFCIIQDENGDKYFISPVLQDAGNTNAHILASEKVLLSQNEQMPISCYTAENAIPGQEEIDKLKIKEHPLSNKLLQLNLAIEASSDYYAIFGNDYNKTITQMLAVMTCVSKIYETELNTVIYIPYIYIWENTATDPYYGKTDVSQKLYVMPKAWKNRSNVSRSLSCLFAALPTQQGIFTAGISMGIGTLCSTNRGYCVFGMYGNNNLPTMNYTWDVNVTAHEVGHGCGGYHTHSCYWNPPIDTCITENLPYPGSDGCVTGTPIPRPGTIMSYCHLTNSTHSVQYIFHPREIPDLRSTLENASCISETPYSKISLLSPLVDTLYKSGTNVPITWTSTKVNNVTIEFTSDGGATWKIIATMLPSSDLRYNWILPYIQSDKVYLMIRDSYNADVADTSFKPLSIHSAMLQLTSVIDGNRYGQKEDIYLTWQSIFADSVDIEFSQEGGNQWTTIETNVKGNNYTVTAPDVISSNCKIRIKSSSDDNLSSESGIFSIGKSTATILEPNGYEKLCIGNTYNIQWQSDFLNKAFIEYSVDNKTTWRKVNIGPLDAGVGKYQWHIPNKQSDSVYLRIYPSINNNDILDISKPFIIDSCQTGVADNKQTMKPGIFILNVIPNPSKDNLVIKVENSLNSNPDAELYIINTKGQTVKNLGLINTISGNIIDINCKTEELAQGTYYIILDSGNSRESYPIQIIR